MYFYFPDPLFPPAEGAPSCSIGGLSLAVFKSISLKGVRTLGCWSIREKTLLENQVIKSIFLCTLDLKKYLTRAEFLNFLKLGFLELYSL